MPTATATAAPSDGKSAVITPNLTFSSVSSDVKISTQPIVTFNNQFLGVVDTTTNSSRNEGVVLLQGAVSSRNLQVSLQLLGPLNANKKIAVGQTFSLSRTGSSLSFEGTDTNASRGDYYSASGAATITALSDDAKTITVSLSNVRMLPDDTFGFAGSGNFTINGTVKGSNLGNRIGAF